MMAGRLATMKQGARTDLLSNDKKSQGEESKKAVIATGGRKQ
jgi:hypothetical protein